MAWLFAFHLADLARFRFAPSKDASPYSPYWYAQGDGSANYYASPYDWRIPAIDYSYVQVGDFAQLFALSFRTDRQCRQRHRETIDVCLRS